MSSGSISAMISSLKSNNRLRRNKKSYSPFYKKVDFSTSLFNSISKEENLKIIEENRRLMKLKIRRNRIFAAIMIVFYVALFSIVVGLLLL